MGSPVSAVVASLFEELALETAPTRPRLWKRYVDDAYCILRKGSTEELLHHLNRGSGQPSSSLWNRKKTGCFRSSTCMLHRRREEGSLDVSIYWKPMHTDHYLHFKSQHPTHVIRGVVRCLHNRVRKIISTQEIIQKEVDHLARVLKQNGYSAMLLPHPHRKQQTQAVMMRKYRRRRGDHWW